MPYLLSYTKAAGVYAARRIWKRLDLGSRIKTIDHVGVMDVTPNDYVDSRLYFFGTWEPSLSAFMRRQITPGSVAIDIGANIGYHTLLFSKAVGKDGAVYAIEPAPRIIEKLRKNISLNTMENIRVIPYGISDKAERRDFVVDAQNLGASHFGETSDDGLELVRLRSVIDPADLSRVSIIKVDVEGFEIPVLRDILDLSTQFGSPLTIVSETRNTPETRALFQEFRAAGFRTLAISNEYRILDYIEGGIMPPTEVVELPPGQTDIAFVRG